MNYFKKIAEIIDYEGWGSIFNRSVDLICYNYLINVFRRKQDFDNWKNLKNKFEGERAFLIGNGPSLNATPLYFLKNEITIAFNRFNLMFERLNWKPTLYTTVDERVALDNTDELNDIVKQLDYCFFPDIHPRGCVDFRKFIQNRENIFWLKLVTSGFFRELPNVGLNGTVANVGIQILAYLGIKNIYLVGLDANYDDHNSVKQENKRDWKSIRDDDPNHFDPRYFGKGKKYHRPRINDIVLPGYQKAKKFSESIGIQIFNATVGGKLEIFDRVDFESLFHYTDAEKFFLLFNEKAAIFQNIYELKNRSIKLSSPMDNYPDPIYISKADIALRLIPKIIFTHIPYGPIEGDYFFIKRDN